MLGNRWLTYIFGKLTFDAQGIPIFFALVNKSYLDSGMYRDIFRWGRVGALTNRPTIVIKKKNITENAVAKSLAAWLTFVHLSGQITPICTSLPRLCALMSRFTLINGTNWNMKTSTSKGLFTWRRDSRLGKFPSMDRKYTVLHFKIDMYRLKTRLAEIPTFRGRISLRRVSQLTHVNSNSRVSCLTGTKGEQKFLGDYTTAGKKTIPSSKSVLN